MIRALDELRTPPRTTRPGCGVPGCSETPSRKPFCAAHVDRLPLAAALIAEQERRDAEIVAALAGKVSGIDPEGTRAQEMLEVLERRGGELRLAGFVRELELEGQGGIRVVQAYALALRRAGLVTIKTRKNRRGDLATWVRLA